MPAQLAQAREHGKRGDGAQQPVVLRQAGAVPHAAMNRFGQQMAKPLRHVGGFAEQGCGCRAALKA